MRWGLDNGSSTTKPRSVPQKEQNRAPGSVAEPHPEHVTMMATYPVPGIALTAWPDYRAVGGHPTMYP